MEKIEAVIERMTQAVIVSYGFSPDILAILLRTDEVIMIVREFWAMFTYNVLTQEFDVEWNEHHIKQTAKKYGVTW